MVISVNQGQILKTPADVGLTINSFTQKWRQNDGLNGTLQHIVPDVENRTQPQIY